MKVTSILVPQAKSLYPCLLLEKTLFDPDNSNVVCTTALSRMHKGTNISCPLCLWHLSGKKRGLYFMFLLSLIISVAYKKERKRLDEI